MTTRKLRLHLSKSLFMRGLQCPKSLFLDRYHPELRDDISASQQRVFQSGTDVGMLARGVHPGGVEIPFAGLTVRQQLQRTAAEIRRGTTTIYEAAFTYDDVFVKVDILHKGARGWELCEVKGTTEVKEVHIDDVAVQYYVLAGSGIDLVKTNLVHLNNQYVRKGDLEVDKLFSVEDITGAVRPRHATIKADVERLKGILKGDMPASISRNAVILRIPATSTATAGSTYRRTRSSTSNSGEPGPSISTAEASSISRTFPWTR